MYPQEIVKPMKEELTSIGFKELETLYQMKKNQIIWLLFSPELIQKPLKLQEI